MRTRASHQTLVASVLLCGTHCGSAALSNSSPPSIVSIKVLVLLLAGCGDETVPTETEETTNTSTENSVQTTTEDSTKKNPTTQAVNESQKAGNQTVNTTNTQETTPGETTSTNNTKDEVSND